MIDDSDLDLIKMVTNQTILSIEYAKANEALAQLYFHTIKALASVIDSKDTYTHGHSLRVAQYSKAIGERLNLSKPELEDIELSALLHDIGKIGIPEQILNKPDKLTVKEYEAIHEHPSKGAKILQEIKEFKNINKGVRHHHEHYDGSGYPDGLKGDKIPLTARIIAVTDSFDAMTSDRAYRGRHSPQKALEEIKRCSGTQFDPTIVDLFSSIASEII
jgi:putative nucleotidyltransferase with HDIG domain